MDEKKCESCKYYQAKDKEDKDSIFVQQDGFCLRYPPIVGIRGFTRPAIYATDICGEWRRLLDA